MGFTFESSDSDRRHAGGRRQPPVTPEVGDARLITRIQARQYLGGVDPAKVLPPVRVCGRVRWDRKALDERLDELSHCRSDHQQPVLSALAQWEAAHDEDAS